jgi:hypothetical protein
MSADGCKTTTPCMEIILRHTHTHTHTHTALHQNLSHPVAAERALQTERGKLNAARLNAARPNAADRALNCRSGAATPTAAPPTTGMDWTTWWFWRGACTRSHPELGREIPQRPWYCVLRHGRVGRRQVFQSIPLPHQTTAGWSSPVARQAHNLKVRGSNPLPATKPIATQ